MKKQNAILTIAGSDSSGGAGVQADIKTFEEFNEIGLSVITAITSQNPEKIISILNIPERFVKDQLQALFDYYEINYVKTGMLYSKETIDVILHFLKENEFNLIIDPIFWASSGSSLMKVETKESLMKNLVPKSMLITPNIPEAEEMVGYKIKDEESQLKAARDIKKSGVHAVLLKGGHLQLDPFHDILIEGDNVHKFTKRRMKVSVHGSGCRLSAAITSNLNKGLTLAESVEISERYIEKFFKK
ncbi:MAG: bifunctional hydroxymethylpyrimidine kinase/phosphomethylpyrimidine kinase [Candidatus Helarchaeota archaeon]